MFDCKASLAQQPSVPCLGLNNHILEPWSGQPTGKDAAGGNDHNNPGQQSGDSQDQENWATSEEWEEDSLFQSILGHVADGFFREAAQLDLETQATDQQPGQGGGTRAIFNFSVTIWIQVDQDRDMNLDQRKMSLPPWFLQLRDVGSTAIIHKC